jgi:putative hemolysin
LEFQAQAAIMQALRVDGTHLEAASGKKARIRLPLLLAERRGALADHID